MRQQSYAGKQNIGSIINRKSAVMKLQIGSFDVEPSSRVTKMSSINSKKRFQNNSSILHKFIENGSRYDTNSRRESLESRISIGYSKNGFQDTNDMSNHTDQIKQLKRKNKQLEEENKKLRKIVGEKNRESTISSQKSLSSFDFGNIFEDSNRILKKKLEQSRTGLSSQRSKISPTNNSTQQVQRLYWQAFRQANFPSIQPLTKVIKSYFQQYQNLFIKINFLTQNVQISNQQLFSQLKQIVNSMKLPMIFHSKPQQLQKILYQKPSGQKLLKSQSKSKIKSNNKQTSSILQQFAPQLLSPQDTFRLLQKLLIKITKSPSMMESLSDKRTIQRLMSKLY